MNSLPLSACTPEPLMSYLKAHWVSCPFSHKVITRKHIAFTTK